MLTAEVIRKHKLDGDALSSGLIDLDGLVQVGLPLGTAAKLLKRFSSAAGAPRRRPIEDDERARRRGPGFRSLARPLPLP